MTTIYLIRHAEAEGNLYRIVQGQSNSLLTDRGWRQVRALKKRFADIHIDAVYASDLYRTCATASAVYRPKGLPLHRVTALREIALGVWEQRTWGDIYRNWPEQMANFGRNVERWHMDGAETPRAVRQRVLEAIQNIAEENPGKTLAIVSHGYAIRLVLAKLQGYTLAQVGKTPTGDNTAVSCLEYENGAFRVVFRDDNSHLKTPEFLANEKVSKRPNALEPGLCFAPLCLPEQKELLCDMVSSAWKDAGETQPFDREQLLSAVEHRVTLVAFREEEPIGLVQFGTESGRISLLYMRDDYRKRGYGVQLIGQAVQYWRPLGSETLSVVLPEGCAAEPFFRDYGFLPKETVEGHVIFEKDIRFDPEYLGHT